MHEIYSENSKKILQHKAKLEKELKVKISFSGKNLCIESTDKNVIEEYIACHVIESLELGFTLHQALLLKDEDFILEKIYIKKLTKRHDLERIRARIIGTKGKTKSIIQELSDCLISLHDNTIGIIGRAEDIKRAIRAIESIIHGQKQSRVYSYLERERTKEKTRIHEDLGLRTKEKRKK